MSKIIEIIAMALGGLSLFAVCFLAFATMSGTPLSNMGGIGSFFDAPEDDDRPHEPLAGARRPPETDPRPTTQIVASSMGVMGAWSLPSPYTQAELKSLTDELKGKLHQLEARAAELDDRERRSEERSELLAERFDALESLRVQLEAFQDELELRALEVTRSEGTAAERNAARWSDMAVVFSELDESLTGQRLVEYPPDEAAQILRALTPDVAAAILNQVETGRWKEYVDAYTALQTEGANGRRRP